MFETESNQNGQTNETTPGMTPTGPEGGSVKPDNAAIPRREDPKPVTLPTPLDDVSLDQEINEAREAI